MPKSEVRQAIATYLDPSSSQIAHLGAVYQALPKVANESDLFMFTPPGTGLGATIYMFLESQQEERIAVGGAANGRKARQYVCSLLCILKSDLTSPDDGQVAFDEFIDALTARIEANRQADSGGVIFQWGEGTLDGGEDIRFEFPVPKTVQGGVMLFQAVGRVLVYEILDT